MKDIPAGIIRRASQGDRKAFQEIYNAASGFVYTVALRIVINPTDAEEVTQEVFIKVYQNLKRFGFRSTFKTWLFRVTTNSAINLYRQKARELGRSADFDTVLETAETPANACDGLHRQDCKKAVESLLSVLSCEQRACIVLREIEGMRYQEIARALKTNINTVRTRLRRAREALMALHKDKRLNDEL